MIKPIASLSCDLDDKWTYLKTFGLLVEHPLPSYLEATVPRLVDFFRARHLHITLFIVGQDAIRESNRPLLRTLADAGHEIASHSFHHDPWMHTYSEAQIDEELVRAEDAIELATGQRPIGFRGPAYSYSESTFRVLAKRGYSYDASTFPNILNPIARAYLFRHSSLSKQAKRMRSRVFGTFRDGFRPNKPYLWRSGDLKLIEIPNTTMPFFRIPFHFNYLLHLAEHSRALALQYFGVALRLCRLTNTAPSLLFGPLDFLGRDHVSDLASLPSMRLRTEEKLEVLSEVLALLCRSFTVVTMGEHARIEAARFGVPVRTWQSTACPRQEII